MTTYYVANSGSDGAAGTIGVPWQTVSKVNGFTFTSGDSILFNRGDTWREQLTVPRGNLTLGQYGSGALPVITGADIMTGLTLAAPSGKLATDANTLALWDFNQTLTDTSAHARTLTATGAVTYGNTTAPFDYYLHTSSGHSGFYSDSQGGDTDAFDFSAATTSYTIEAWIRIASGACDASASYMLVSKTSAAWGNFSSYSFGLFSNGSIVVLRCAYSDSGANVTFTSSDIKAALNNGGWHHVALRVDLNNVIDHNLSTWFDGVSVGSSSLAGRSTQANAVNMTIGAMPDGSLPFTGDIEQVRFSNIARVSFPTTPGSATAYTKSGVTTAARTVIYNGVGLTEKHGLLGGVGMNQWDWAANVLYVNVGEDPSLHTVEVGQRDFGITNSASAASITLDSLQVTGANVAGILSSQNNGWIVQNSNIWGCGNFNLFIRGNPSGAGPATGVIVQGNSIGIVSRDPSTGQGSGIAVGGCTAPIIRNNLSVATVNGVGINVSSGDMAGAQAASTAAEVYGNVVKSNDFNIVVAFTPTSLIHDNVVHDSRGLGISLHTSINGKVYSNLIYNLLQPSSDSLYWNGIDINTSSTGATIAHNTVIAVTGCGITIESSSTGCTVKNNLLDARLNVICPVALWASPIYVDSTISNVQVTLSNNCYVPRTSSLVGNWQTVEKILAAWNTSSNDASSIAPADPVFNNATIGDFRLKRGSSARAVGTTVSGVNEVVRGSAPDIGVAQLHRRPSLAFGRRL